MSEKFYIYLGRFEFPLAKKIQEIKDLKNQLQLLN